MKFRYLLTTAAIAAMVMPAVASAQVLCNAAAGQNNCSVTNTLTATAPNILRLTISTSGSGTDLATALPNPVEADYDNYATPNNWPTTTTAVTVTARANRRYYVTATAGSWQFQASATYQACWGNTGTYGAGLCLSSAYSNVAKPASDLRMFINTANTAPTTSDAATSMASAVDVIGSSATPAVPGSTPTSRYVFYRSGWDYANDVPGDYKVVVTYTITGN